LREYDHVVANDARSIRNLLINKLLENVVGARGAVQLRAIEMMGKVRGVSLFEDSQATQERDISDEETDRKLREKLELLSQRREEEARKQREDAEVAQMQEPDEDE